MWGAEESWVEKESQSGELIGADMHVLSWGVVQAIGCARKTEVVV